MSNDLISRSALLQKIKEDKEFLQKGLGRDAEYAYMSADSVMNKIKSMPAVYDVDKVIQQMEEHKKSITGRKERDILNTVGKTNAKAAVERDIEIVKSGGIG